MDKLTIYDFPHFEKFETMYNFLGNNIPIWSSYLGNNLFIAFLQTIAFFIVAARYDKLQRRREFLRGLDSCVIYIKLFFERDKTIPEFRHELGEVFQLISYFHIYSDKDIRPILEKFSYLTDQKLTKKEIEKYLIDNQRFFMEERTKLQRKKEWVLF